jgi:hypothetical protein
MIFYGGLMGSNGTSDWIYIGIIHEIIMGF